MLSMRDMLVTERLRRAFDLENISEQFNLYEITIIIIACPIKLFRRQYLELSNDVWLNRL